MKKFFTLAVAGFTFLSGFAISPIGGNALESVKSIKDTKEFKIRENRSSSKKKSNLKPEEIGDVLTNVEGTTKVFVKEADGYQYGESFQFSDTPAEIVFGENNEVYFYEILSGSGTSSFTKGVLDGDEITVSLPQTAYYSTGSLWALDLVLLQFDEDFGMYVTSDETSVTYNVASDGTISLNLPGEDYILGLVYTDDGSWAGYGDFSQVYTPYDGEVNEFPSDAEVLSYVYNNGTYGYPIEVVIDGSDLYIKGLSYLMPRGIIKANITGNQAIVPENQLAGIYYTYFIYTKNMVLNPDFDYDDLSSYLYQFAPEGSEYILNIDFENQTITPEDTSLYLGLNADLEYMIYLEAFGDYSLENQESYAGTPQNPFDLYWDDYYYWDYGYFSFMFSVPNLSTDNKVLNNSDLYYRIYADGELFEFEEDIDTYEYMGIEGVVTEVPFEFTNDNDFYKWGYIDREVGFYIDGLTTVGVQSVYNYEGNTTTSSIIVLNLETGEVTEEKETGISSVSNSENGVSEFFNINGTKVDNPDKGIYIKRTMLKDGSLKVNKVIRK